MERERDEQAPPVLLVGKHRRAGGQQGLARAGVRQEHDFLGMQGVRQPGVQLP